MRRLAGCLIHGSALRLALCLSSQLRADFGAGQPMWALGSSSRTLRGMHTQASPDGPLLWMQEQVKHLMPFLFAIILISQRDIESHERGTAAHRCHVIREESDRSGRHTTSVIADGRLKDTSRQTLRRWAIKDSREEHHLRPLAAGMR